MKAPPPELDGARVRLWSPLDSRHRKTEKIRLYSDGHEQTSFEGLAIATYEKKSAGAYVFFCDANWSVVNDSLYRDIGEAKRAAEAQFEGLASTWTEV